MATESTSSVGVLHPGAPAGVAQACAKGGVLHPGAPAGVARHLLSPLSAWALAFGCAVGWGSFVMPGTTFLPKAGPLGTILGIFIGGIVMAVIAWNYHAMMNRLPGPGGAYLYATRAFGHDHGFLCAWFLALTYIAIVWANATALSIVARFTLGDVFRFGFRYTLADFDIYLGDILLSGAAIVAAAAICCRRRLACGVQTVFAVGFALGILICFASVAADHQGGLATMKPAFAPNAAHPSLRILSIVSLAPWLFVGFESISHASGEFRFPLRRSFGIMVASLAVSVFAYGMLAILPALMSAEGATGWPAYLRRIGEQQGPLTLPTFAAVSHALGPVGVALMGITMFGAIFTGLVGNTFAASRLLAALADDGILFPWAGRRNADGSPRNAVLAIAAVSVFIPLLGRTAISFIVDISTVGAAIAYAYTSAASWKMAPRGPSGRWMRLAGVGGISLSAVVLLLFIIPNYASGTMMATESYLLLVLWCIFGFLHFRSVFRRDKAQRFGQSTIVWVAILILITLMSLLWMRQMTSDTTRYVFSEIRSLHDNIHPGGPEDPGKNVWAAGTDRLREVMNTALLRGGLVQTGLLALAFAILFNLYTMLREREHALIREKTLRQRERDLEREKSKARSYFFSTVSHDIRTPLNAIIGFSEMLKAGFQTEAEREQAIDSIIVSGQTLLGLINDILDLSKLEAGKMEIAPEPTDCARLLRDVLDAFRVAASKPGLELRLEADAMPRLMIDPQRLRQIAFNLVGNAVKFTERGHVALRATFTPGADGADGTFRLAVEDTGCGISEENLKRISSAYVQVGSKISRNGGTGLGLAICKQLAAAMGGTLSVTSTLGKGSTFTITIPDVAVARESAPLREKGCPVSPDAPPREEGGPKGRGVNAPPMTPPSFRILIVDDSTPNRMVLKAHLNKFGITDVETATDGIEALERLRAPGAAPFDLVLTDLWMPNLDGEGLVKAIRADPALASLCVVVVTADVELRGKAKDLGFDGILLKPMTVASVRSALSEFSRHKGNGA